ncbi:GNAT family N-acetyltransferase [Namhaeicola litoreus]|uniref:GNAT family N-acetyltransferase n=1 Tax=Namhaeicola litoreus TaxID=1052145 RepID=A0ABW3Y4V9_9FLAO
MNDTLIIRRILPTDNTEVSRIIKSVLVEHDAAREGTAYMDKETDAMYQAYQDNNEAYFVAILDNKIVGGAGIKHLSQSEDNICELQKMYILPEARNRKVGKELILKCLEFAKYCNYEKCYLETFPQMQAAINLYVRNGFTQINQALGNTSHYACNVWMIKNLEQTK